jgi:mannosyltransferase OCH1-like enzyme
MIPKIIWQTYKLPQNGLAPYMKAAAQTWIDMNPNYEYKYMDDTQAEKFVLDEYGSEWHKIFIDCPVGVMRGDLWRYLVIYKYGGVYTDLDTECQEPIDVWLNKDYDFIVCPENEIHFCQWTFASSPGNPVLKSVLDEIKQRFISPDYTRDHFVHELTGPGVWTRGILNALNVDSIKNLTEDGALLCNSSDNAKLYKFYCYNSTQWRIFHFMSVRHLYGSQTWKDGNYVRWIQETLEFQSRIGNK